MLKMEMLSGSLEFVGVKALAERGLDRLPHRFIRPLEERPASFAEGEDDHIPTIDLQLQRLDMDSSLPANIVEDIGRLCNEWGCFQVINHGISSSTMNEMMEAARGFFGLPEDQKMKYYSSNTSSKFRYASSFNMDKDRVLNWRDFIRYSCCPLEEAISAWPANPPSFSNASVKFCAQVNLLVKIICTGIFQSLGLPEDYIEKELRDCSQTMVCNYYPPCPEPERAIGVGSHTDPGWITVLMQDEVGGLQVLHRHRWVPAKPNPNAFFVNLGDVLQIVSNGRYKSVEHRATVNAITDRLSVLTTYGPSLNAIIKPAPQLLNDSVAAVYGEIFYKDYMDKVLNASLDDKRYVDFHALKIEERTEN